MKQDNQNKKKNIIIVILIIIIILLLLYLLIHNFGKIENYGPKVPTGNVDVFDIDCTCEDCTKDVFNEDDDTNKDKSSQQNRKDYNSGTTEDYKDIIVYDNYKIWDNKKLRIFSNPAYEYQSKLAPGSENSYAFMIRNNNNFAVTVDITFEEENEKDINMQYKLKNNGDYLIGSENNYQKIENKKVTGITLPAKSSKSYILDWKWIDSDNDTQIGFDPDANYKLSITIGANQ